METRLAASETGQAPSLHQGTSHQFLQLLLIQMLHHFADILRLVERGDEKGVVRLDNDQITHAYQGDKFSGGVHVIILRIQGKTS